VEQVRLSLVAVMFPFAGTIPWKRLMNLKPRPSLGRGFFCKSAVLQLLDSVANQLAKLLRFSGEGLHLVLSEQNDWSALRMPNALRNHAT
jgi:hypothetical protein